MDNLYDKILSMKKIKLMPSQVLVENNITIDGKDDVERILAVNANVDLDMPIEALSGECVVTGKIITNILFVVAGGEINNQTSVSPFSYKIIDENICSGARLNISAKIVNTELDKLIENQLKVINTINLDSVVLKNVEVEYLKDVEENMFIKQEEKTITTYQGGFYEKIEEKVDFDIKTGVKKVLATNVECFVKNWTTGQNFISIECELNAKILYADKQEVSELQTISETKTIKHEIEVDGLGKNCEVEVFASIVNENVMVEISEGEESANICISAPILIYYNKFECSNILTISDIYSCKNILSIENDSVDNCKNLTFEYIEEKITGNVTLSEDQPRIDKYLATTNVRTLISNSYVKSGMLYLEGIVCANVVYLNDESEILQSVEIEIPYVVDKKIDAPDNVLVEAVVGVVDVDVITKRGRDIYFDGKIKGCVSVACEKAIDFITKISEIGELENKNGAIEIYFGKMGESLWDIAKTLKISSETIRNQNPEITDPLDKDQSIALYFQKQR